MALSPQNAAIREHSGSVNSRDPLVSFLYQILRDHLPAGTVEDIMQQHVFPPQFEEGSVTEFCNGYIARYAQDVANRLKPELNEDKLWREIYARNAEEGRNRFFVSHVVNYHPDLFPCNPDYFILWEISQDHARAKFLFKGSWNRLLRFLKEEIPLSPLPEEIELL